MKTLKKLKASRTRSIYQMKELDINIILSLFTHREWPNWSWEKYYFQLSIVISLGLCTRVHCCVTAHFFCPFVIVVSWFVRFIKPKYFKLQANRPSLDTTFQLIPPWNDLFIFNCARHEHFNQTRYLKVSVYKRGCIIRC